MSNGKEFYFVRADQIESDPAFKPDYRMCDPKYRKITDRMHPLIEVYSDITDRKFNNDKAKDEAVMTVREMGFFSVQMLESLLAEAKSQANEILCNDIPLLLAEYGLSKATLSDGTEVGKELYTEVSQAGLDKELLASWLTEHGYASAIKDVLSFDKGAWQDEIGDFLREHGYSYSRDSSIHSQTLKKVIKDHVASGGELPPQEAVKVSMFERGVVKAPKLKRDF